MYHDGLEDLRVRSLKALIKIRKALGSQFNADVWNTTHIFNYMVRPILLYCSDFWGCLKPPSNNPIERFHLSFCKQLLGVRKQTNTVGVLLELGMRTFLFTSTPNQKQQETTKIPLQTDTGKSSQNTVSLLELTLRMVGLLETFKAN